jgi:hypothetical protein
VHDTCHYYRKPTWRDSPAVWLWTVPYTAGRWGYYSAKRAAAENLTKGGTLSLDDAQYWSERAVRSVCIIPDIVHCILPPVQPSLAYTSASTCLAGVAPTAQIWSSTCFVHTSSVTTAMHTHTYYSLSLAHTVCIHRTHCVLQVGKEAWSTCGEAAQKEAIESEVWRDSDKLTEWKAVHLHGAPRSIARSRKIKIAAGPELPAAVEY